MSEVEGLVMKSNCFVQDGSISQMKKLVFLHTTAMLHEADYLLG
jgi:hypothetical protein